ncbi:hypothetical protein FHS27_005987 [Rhodopirellula rubra]|uniref:Uncharacterized protein n=1 Tax=Aporhodopirellula rubra TaxID=980271 RepID=A0A7W5H9I6_9BACT|nr:hypothetical protein [Aporhodopirellula rubra]
MRLRRAVEFVSALPQHVSLFDFADTTTRKHSCGIASTLMVRSSELYTRRLKANV